MSTGFDQRRAKRRQAIATGYGSNQGGVVLERPANQAKRKCQIVDAVQRSDRKAEIVLLGAEVMPILFDSQAAGPSGKEWTGISDVNRLNDA